MEAAETSDAQGGGTDRRSALGEKVDSLSPAMREKNPHAGGYFYKLSDAAKEELGPLFAEKGYDVSKVRLDPTGAFGRKGLTFGDTVFLTDKFAGMDFGAQIELLGHEVTHSVQYQDLGTISFLLRYRQEWHDSGGWPYGIPPALQATPIQLVNPIDQSYYLDQLADRFGAAAVSGR